MKKESSWILRSGWAPLLTQTDRETLEAKKNTALPCGQSWENICKTLFTPVLINLHLMKAHERYEDLLFLLHCQYYQLNHKFHIYSQKLNDKAKERFPDKTGCVELWKMCIGFIFQTRRVTLGFWSLSKLLDQAKIWN